MNLTGSTITSATLTIRNISNWDSNANRLFIHLLDTARNAGVASFQDAPASQTPVTDINDNFAGTALSEQSSGRVGNGKHIPDVAVVYDHGEDLRLTPSRPIRLSVLSAYFMNGGDIAFGLDPDCHFWNDGIVFSFTTKPTATPEPTTMVLLGTGLAGLYYNRKRKKQAKIID